MTELVKGLVDLGGAADLESLEILFSSVTTGLCTSTSRTYLRRIGYKFRSFATLQVATFGK